jgi:hypothetical protein
MKVARSVVVVVLVAIIAAISFLYGVPSGRRVRRESLRAFRLGRNAVGIAPLPVVTVRMWNAERPRALRIEVYESGRVVALTDSERIERQLSPDAIADVVESARAALGDFNTGDCGTSPRDLGFSAELYLLIDGARVGSTCRDASKWPDTFGTRQLFSELEKHIPRIFSALEH